MTISTAEMSPPLSTYRERFPGLQREFELFPDKVRIRGRSKGNPFETTVPLRQLDPDYGYATVRPLRPFLSVISLALSAFLLWLVLGPGGAPITSPAAWIPGLLVVSVVGLTIYYFPRVRVFRFLNASGLIVLDVFESGPHRARAEEFVQLIAETIRKHRTPDAAASGAGT